MYESRVEQVISKRQFAIRMLKHLLLALAFILVSLLCSMLGYMWFEDGVHWHDAALNMAMIASGIGPTMLPATVQGKIFLALYSAYISVVFVAVLGLVMAPIMHRILHVFHLDDDEA
ncbi:hypothetical protein [Pusillimonas sp. NJUB218]|uniref:hypothetical protein n=1 Tax=Pusillimonas sp. NJUB218 TaxID=2023230 RepID=UPI000F4BEB9E|nr:hypothetical protein [Pusillimonas sp. NJUB218]ROT44308.1 hypothetical protein CHR62_13400 [Pusillimonas sp. NJUB218]